MDLDKVKEVLEFYADPDLYEKKYIPCLCGKGGCVKDIVHPIMQDSGARASELLKVLNKDESRST